ncbi:DNA-protecting protein DprA [bacterium]|nr:DNA-protecting protein DprA [bacterium]
MPYDTQKNLLVISASRAMSSRPASRGIDAATHRGALATGTIAVIAGGIDSCYPLENIELQQIIVETGLIVAKMPPGTQPTARHFPIRNRIIASLAQGVVVVEAAVRSGSLITAREATERGGEFMAIPGSPLDPRSSGGNILIREGATLVQSSEDIIEYLAHPIKAGVPASAEWNGPATPPRSKAEIADCRKVILEGLGTEPNYIDDLVRWCDAPTAFVQVALVELELAEIIIRHHGKRVSKLVTL